MTPSPISDSGREYLRLLEAWDQARKAEQQLTERDPPAVRAKARQITEFSFQKLEQFYVGQAAAWDVMVRAKKYLCPDGDTSLELVLGENIRLAIDQRLSNWQRVATELTKQVESLKHEVTQLKRQLRTTQTA